MFNSKQDARAPRRVLVAPDATNAFLGEPYILSSDTKLLKWSHFVVNLFCYLENKKTELKV